MKKKSALELSSHNKITARAAGAGRRFSLLFSLLAFSLCALGYEYPYYLYGRLYLMLHSDTTVP